MNRKKLFYFAAFLVLFTFVGHSLGTLLPQNYSDQAHVDAQVVMENTIHILPFNTHRSLAQMFYGGNAIGSLYLLATGASLILFARPEHYNKRLIQVHSAGLLLCALICFLFFFPLPALCTGLAGVIGFYAITRPS